jgi:hypothetical protein
MDQLEGTQRMKFSALPIVAALLSSNIAMAGWEAGANGGHTMLINPDRVSASGLGFGIRAGYALDFGLVPELVIGDHMLSVQSTDLMVMSVAVGARYILLEDIFDPFLAVHVGTYTTTGSGFYNYDDGPGLTVDAQFGCQYEISDSLYTGPIVSFGKLLPAGGTDLTHLGLDFGYKF